MALYNFYCNILQILIVLLISQCQEVIESDQNGLFQFQLTTQYNQHQYQQFLITQILDSNYLSEFRYYHTVEQEVILSLEIGKDKKLFNSIISHEDYHNQTHQLTFIYNPITFELHVEIIQVQNNQKILQLQHYQNLKLSIIQMGGSDKGLSKYYGIIQLLRLSFRNKQIIASINGALIETQNEFQHLVLDQSQKDYIITNKNYSTSNQITFYGNIYEEKAELNLQFDNYQHICITDLFFMNEESKLIIDSQSKETISFILQNSTIRGYFWTVIQKFAYLEINNVNFNNITDLSFIFQKETTNLTIKFINTSFYNCQFSKSQLFPPIESGDITFINVQFIQCLFTHNSFIQQPYPGFLQISMKSILIMQSDFLIENMFQDIAVVYVEGFKIQECNLSNSMIFSGNSQITFNDFEIYNSQFDQSFLILMFIGDLDIIQYAFKLEGLIIKNNTIKHHQANLIAVTGYKYCQISNCIYQENQIMSNQQQYIFFIVADLVNINNFHIEKTYLQTEFNIKYSEMIIVKNIVLSGINNHHLSFIEFGNSTQFSLRNVTISNLEMIDSQLFIFQARTLQKFIISDVYIYNVNYNFSNFSSQGKIEMFKLIACNQIDISNLNINNITYFIGLNELKQSYLIFHFFGSKLDVEINNISIQNVYSYCLEQYSGIVYLSAPIIYVEGSVLSVRKSRFENLISNSTTADNYMGQLVLSKIEIVSSNFSNISGLQIFQIQLLRMGLSYFYDCIFHNITLFNQDSLILFDSSISQLTCQVNEIILQSIKCQQSCKFMEFITSQINNQVVISNIDISDIQLMYFSGNNDKCLVALQNLTVSNKNLLLANMINLQCHTIIMQNLSFLGSTCGNFLNLQNFRSLQLYQIYVVNSVFYESSILYFKSKIKESLIIIRQLEMYNNQIISQDIFSQRILQNINNQFLFEIITQDSQMKVFIEFSQFTNNICSQCYKSLINLQSNNNSESQFVIQSTLFQKNKGSIQSLIQIENFQLFELRQVVFYNNTEEDQYLISSTNTEGRLFLCQIFNDKAFQNASIRIDYNIPFSQFFGQYYEQNTSQNKNNQPQIVQKSGIPLHLRLFQNDAQFQVDSFRNLTVLLDYVKVNKYKIYGEEQYQNQILLPSNNLYPYSQYYPYQQTNIFYDLNYTIRIIDRQGDIIVNQYDQQLKIEQYLYNLTQQTYIELLDEQQLYFDPFKQGFNLENFKIKFNPYSDDYLCIQLKIKYEKLEHYYFLINVRTFQCQIGEYLSNNACHQCDENKYQYSLNSHEQICKQVDFTIIEEFNYNQVKLRKGFWRKDILSEEFLFCENNPNCCQGGWKAGNQQCAISYIGTLCEECDQNNIMGNGQFYKDFDNLCQKCNNYKSVLITISTIGWLIILASYVIKNIEHQNRLFQQYFLQYKKQFEILYKLNQNQQNTVIKQFFNISLLYMLISLINGWFTDNPIYRFLFFISNPLSFNKLHMQCLFEIHDPRYLLVIYVISPYILILLILVCLYFVIKHSRTTSTINYSSIIFIISLLQPNIVRELGLFLSQRQIQSNIYTKGSLNYLYYSIPHQNWIKIFIAPQFLYYSLTLPLLLFYFLFRIRNDRFQMVNRFRFNILFNDYKKKFYFWEIYKILNKEIVIILIIFYDNQIRMLQIIFLLISVYCFLINKFKPFNLVKQNKFESQNHIILQINIILLIVLHSLSSQDYIKQIILVLVQTSSLILLVLFFYQLKLNTQRLFYGLIRKIVINNPFKYKLIQNWVQKKEEQQMKINIYWNLIKTRSRRIGRIGSQSSLPTFHNQGRVNQNSDIDKMNDYCHIDSPKNIQN